MIAIADTTADGQFDFLISPKLDSGWLPALVHRGGANVLFCDGHVQWYLQKDLIRPAELSTEEQVLRWHAVERMWNNDCLPHLES